MKKKISKRTSKITAGLVSLLALLTIGVLALLLTTDIIAASVIEGALKHKGLICSGGVEADLSLLDRSVTLEPLKCHAESGPIEFIELESPMKIRLDGAEVSQAAMSAKRARVHFRSKGKATSEGGFDNSSVSGLNIQRALRRLLLDLAEASKKTWPDMQIDAMELTHQKPTATVALDNARLATDPESGALTIKVDSAKIATGRKKKRAPVKVEDAEAVVTMGRATFSGTISVSKGIGLATINVPIQIRITAVDFEDGDPKWSFDAAPGLPSVE